MSFRSRGPAALALLAPLALLVAPAAAPADLVSPTVNGSVTRSGGPDLFAPPTTNVPVGPAEEFRGELIRISSGFGTDAADAFADVDRDGITLGIQRTLGANGISTNTPVAFEFTGLDFSPRLTGLNTTVRSGTFGRGFETSFTQNSVTVTLANGFTLDSSEAMQSLRVEFVSAVPEPSALLLIAACGLVGFGAKRRRAAAAA